MGRPRGWASERTGRPVMRSAGRPPGTIKRIPSIAATMPPPNACASGIPACPATRNGFAAW